MPLSHVRESVCGWQKNRGRRFSTLATWLLFFSAGLVWHGEVLLWRPYGEVATGLWTQASFLADTGFDFRSLHAAVRSNELLGQAHVSPLSAAVVAVLMQVVPSLTFVLWHVIVVAAVAFSATLAVRFVQTVQGALPAWLLGVGFMATPAVSAQSEQLGTIAIATALGMATIHSLALGKERQAVFLAALALMVDVSGLLVAIGSAMFSLAHLPWHGHRGIAKLTRTTPWRATVALAIISIIGTWYWYEAGPSHGNKSDAGRYTLDMEGWIYAARFWAPDAVLLVLVAIGLPLAIGSKHRHIGRLVGRLTRSTDGQQPRGSSTVSTNEDTCVVGFASNTDQPAATAQGRGSLDPLIGQIAWWMLLAACIGTITKPVLPADLMLPVAMAVVVLGCYLPCGRRPLVCAALAIAVIFQIGNQSGRFYPPVLSLHGPETARTSHLLVRSLEYRADYRASVAAIDAVRTNAESLPVLVASPYSHYLALPRLGYVNRPHFGYCLQPVLQAHPVLQPLRQAIVDWPVEAVILWAASREYVESPLLVLTGPEPRDEILFEQHDGGRLVVFRHRWRADNEPLPWTWLFQRFSLYASVYHRAMGRALVLQHAGQTKLAVAEIERELKYSPRNADLYLTLARLFINADQPRAAEAKLLRAIEIDKHHTDARVELALLYLRLNRPDEALEQLRPLLDQRPPLAKVHYAMGVACVQQGRIDAGIVHFRRSLEIEPHSADAHYNIGILLVQKGERTAAIHHLREALRLRPDYGAAKLQLQRLGESVP